MTTIVLEQAGQQDHPGRRALRCIQQASIGCRVFCAESVGARYGKQAEYFSSGEKDKSCHDDEHVRRVAKFAEAQYASAPNEKTIAIVFSRPITSEIQPKKGRARPLKMLSKTSALLSVVAVTKRIVTSWSASLKSAAIGAICAVAISPELATRINMTQSSQKIGDLSISRGAYSRSDCVNRRAGFGVSAGCGARKRWDKARSLSE